ncbi:aflatoxin B1 aldehyde reductase-like protein [Apiospora saccharicola]
MSLARPRLILGGASIGDDQKTLAEVQVVLGTALWLGIDEVDAGTLYSNFNGTLYSDFNMGASEKLLGEAKAVSKGLSVDIKLFTTGNNNIMAILYAIRMSLDFSRKNLQLDGNQKINVLYCPAPDYRYSLEDQASALDELHKQGLFDKLGVCDWPVFVLVNFIKVCECEGYVQPSVYQGPYNLVERRHEAIMPTLRKYGIRFDAQR